MKKPHPFTLDCVAAKHAAKVHEVFDLRDDNGGHIVIRFKTGAHFNGLHVVRAATAKEARAAIMGSEQGSTVVVGWEAVVFHNRLDVPVGSRFISDQSGYARIFNGWHAPYIIMLNYDVPIYSKKPLKRAKK